MTTVQCHWINESLGTNDTCGLTLAHLEITKHLQYKYNSQHMYYDIVSPILCLHPYIGYFDTSTGVHLRLVDVTRLQVTNHRAQVSDHGSAMTERPSHHACVKLKLKVPLEWSDPLGSEINCTN